MVMAEAVVDRQEKRVTGDGCLTKGISEYTIRS
jgi:hypothetical protein